MGEYIIINDVHLSDRPPSSCTDTYLDDLFALLYEATWLAEQRHAAGVILAGDVFHHKTPSRTTHATVMRLIEWARASAAQVWTILGNHDLLHDRTASIDETQPLGVVIRSGAIKLLDGWMSTDAGNTGDVIFGLPWQMVWDETAVWEGLQLVREVTERFPDTPALVVTHAPLYPPGDELPYEYFPAHTFAEAMGGRGTVHYGHVHQEHGVYEVGGVTFSNCGALSRGSLHEHNLTRKVKVAVWNSSTGAVEHVELPHKPADQVFRLVEAQAAKTAGLSLAGFLSTIEATKLDVSSTEAVIAHVRALGLDDDLVKLVTGLLDKAAA